MIHLVLVLIVADRNLPHLGVKFDDEDDTSDEDYDDYDNDDDDDDEIFHHAERHIHQVFHFSNTFFASIKLAVKEEFDHDSCH